MINPWRATKILQPCLYLYLAHLIVVIYGLFFYSNKMSDLQSNSEAITRVPQSCFFVTPLKSVEEMIVGLYSYILKVFNFYAVKCNAINAVTKSSQIQTKANRVFTHSWFNVGLNWPDGIAHKTQSDPADDSLRFAWDLTLFSSEKKQCFKEEIENLFPSTNHYVVNIYCTVWWLEKNDSTHVKIGSL